MCVNICMDNKLLELCADDPAFFAKKMIRIMCADGTGPTPIKLTKQMTGWLTDFHNQDDILDFSPRQTYKTTTLCIFTLWFQIFHGNRITDVVSPTKQMSYYLYHNFQQFISLLPEGFNVIDETAYESITFTNGSVLRFVTAASNIQHSGPVIDLAVFDEIDHIRPHIRAELYNAYRIRSEKVIALTSKYQS